MKFVAATLLLAVSASANPDVTLATFDGADKATTFKWAVMNDPVMGGGSTSSWQITDNIGVFNGTCNIVKFLKAPGFASVHTDAGFFGHNTFNDAGSTADGSIDLMVRSSTPTYQGFKIGWSAKGIPIKPQYGGGPGSFKAGFQLKDQADWQLVQIPMTNFSDDWSPFTGRCDTKDPNGKQHHCCGTGDASQYCPTAKFLSALTDLAIWAEGVAGDFHIEVKWLGASKAANPKVCKPTEYCCPDAKHCLTPTKTSCLTDDACASGDVCCPLTKICVTPGAPCATTCDDQGSYCCPDALACLTPTNPGVFCDGDNAKCNTGEVCCPLTKLCVSAGDKCTPP